MRALTLHERFEACRRQTRRLAAELSAEDCQIQSMPDASPVKWHLAHTTWFFETFILKSLADYQVFDPAYAFLFNSYYETLGPRHARPRRGLISRPSLSEVLAYRSHVDEAVGRLFASKLSEEQEQFVVLGIHHEQQHQELLVTDFKHALSQNPCKPAWHEGELEATATAEPIRYLPFEGGVHWMGALKGEAFAFDNERPRHECLLRPFEMANRVVTNAEYLEFVQAGGYERADLWLSDGWSRVCEEGWARPLYWYQEGEQIFEFTCNGLSKLDPHGPVVHLSYYEADAYATFAEARLPTEAEWEVAASAELAKGCRAGQLLESERWHPGGAARPQGEAQSSSWLGDVWEWTASSYGAYPGYERPRGALGEYNGKFMCGQQVLRGGSCATPGSHIRPSYRNFFPPGARWQFSGVRLARDVH